MTPDQSREEIVIYWMEKAGEALDSAKSELSVDRLSFAMNRAYYACFYAASAILLKKGKKFSKHSGVRAALHQQLVRPGILSAELGKYYDRLFKRRQDPHTKRLQLIPPANLAPPSFDNKGLDMMCIK